jgi:hypothetical protein
MLLGLFIYLLFLSLLASNLQLMIFIYYLLVVRELRRDRELKIDGEDGDGLYRGLWKRERERRIGKKSIFGGSDIVKRTNLIWVIKYPVDIHWYWKEP